MVVDPATSTIPIEKNQQAKVENINNEAQTPTESAKPQSEMLFDASLSNHTFPLNLLEPFVPSKKSLNSEQLKDGESPSIQIPSIQHLPTSPTPTAETSSDPPSCNGNDDESHYLKEKEMTNWNHQHNSNAALSASTLPTSEQMLSFQQKIFPPLGWPPISFSSSSLASDTTFASAMAAIFGQTVQNGTNPTVIPHYLYSPSSVYSSLNLRSSDNGTDQDAVTKSPSPSSENGSRDNIDDCKKEEFSPASSPFSNDGPHNGDSEASFPSELFAKRAGILLHY